MSKPVVLMVPMSRSNEVIAELFPELSQHNVLIKVMEDDLFNTMFSIDTEDVELDISDETFLAIAKMAHEKDLTINQTITQILRKQLEETKARDKGTEISDKDFQAAKDLIGGKKCPRF